MAGQLIVVAGAGWCLLQALRVQLEQLGCGWGRAMGERGK